MQKRNHKGQQLLEWTLCADEQTWQDAQQGSLAGGVSEPHPLLPTPHHRHRLPIMLALLLAVAVCGGWWGWQRAQSGLAAVESEVEDEIVAELWQSGATASPSVAVETRRLGMSKLPSDPSELVTNLALRDLGKDWAVVDVTLQPTADGPSYRQTRVYRSSERGWQRAEPSATRWGVQRHLESQYFIFVYYSTDEEAVIQAAPQLDALFVRMVVYGYTLPLVTEKVTITVDPAHNDRNDDQKLLPAAIVVPSPAATLLPADLSASEALLQSCALALFDLLAARAATRHERWGPEFRLQNALRLWFIWQNKLPFERWRKPLVQWFIAPPHDAQRRDAEETPAFAHDLCAHHQLWGRYPPDMGVPLSCWQNKAGEEQITVSRYQRPISQLSAGPLLYGATSSPGYENASAKMTLPAFDPYTILLATLFEYVTTTYGNAKLPQLLAAMPQHERAVTLIPAVFGITADEFQSQWRLFLVERYELNAAP